MQVFWLTDEEGYRYNYELIANENCRFKGRWMLIRLSVERKETITAQ
jgi:hypothetical protein